MFLVQTTPPPLIGGHLLLQLGAYAGRFQVNVRSHLKWDLTVGYLLLIIVYNCTGQIQLNEKIRIIRIKLN
jgi:hypothetical protein